MRKNRRRNSLQNFTTIANKLSINSVKTNVVLFQMKNKPVPRNFTCITTEAMQINRVKSVQYLGMLLDENLY